MLLKYDFSENTTGRVSVGKGWRTVNLFSEYVTILSSNKNIYIADNLQPEEAFNFGINMLHAVYLEDFELQFIVDFYKTNFSNQIFPDYDSNPNTITINNFNETSTSNSFQAEIGMEIIKQLGIKIAYNYLDVFREINDEKIALPFIAKHHILHTFSYQPLDKDWFYHFNLHWF